MGISFVNVDPSNAANVTAALFDHSLYSAFVVASVTSCGGCDNSPAAIANIAAQSAAIASFFNAGGGIVADSNPEQEYRETLDKARGMIDALVALLDDVTARHRVDPARVYLFGHSAGGNLGAGSVAKADAQSAGLCRGAELAEGLPDLRLRPPAAELLAVGDRSGRHATALRDHCRPARVRYPAALHP